MYNAYPWIDEGVCAYLALENPPVDPNPPLPRVVSSSESTSSTSGVEIFSMTSCAMRSPAWTVVSEVDTYTGNRRSQS